MTIRKASAYAGLMLTFLILGLLSSLVMCHHLHVSHPLEGSLVASFLLLGSPLFLLFQIYATMTTRKLDARRAIRIGLLTVNAIGIAVWSLGSLLLLIIWKLGPINPG